MELSYEASPTGLTFQTQYNGNISGVRWSNEHHDGTQRSYGYTYDGMNRINDALYKENTGATWTVNNGYYDAYNISYDKNGNIEGLMRKDNNVITDNLGYTYIDGGNRLKAVNDSTSSDVGFNDGEESTTEYEYDGNGNMTRDYNKEVQSITYNLLNLPELITFENNNTIEYYYDAAGIKWKKEVTGGATTTETDYIGSMIFEDSALQQIHTAEGRIVANRVGAEYDYQYQYVLKDHLGNSRVTFGATEQEYLATMESELAGQEEAQFENIADYRVKDFQYNHTPGGEYTPDESVMLNANQTVNGTRRVVGAAKGLKIQAGDTVDMEVWAKYPSTCGVSETTASAFLFAALTSGLGIVSTGETAQAYTAMNSLLGTTTLFDQEPCDVPKAYLNYIFFDENYANPGGGIPAGRRLHRDTFQKLSLSFAASAAGYLYIYVSNESSLDVNVYFDDMKITHKSDLSVIQADDYFPFGLTMSSTSYQREGEQPNAFLYNGKELQDDLDLNWYDYGARMYDASIGRWHVVDPWADSSWNFSPYHFVSNNPINRIDPDGRDDFEINSLGEIVNRITNEEADNIHIVDKDGARVEGQSISFEYGTISAVRNPEVDVRNKKGGLDPKTLTVLEVNGDENATQLFEFLADPSNTSVEWSHSKIGTDDSDRNIVGTSHDESSTPVGSYLRATDYTLREVVHNHPGKTGPSPGDLRNAKIFHDKNPNTVLKLYHHPKKYFSYTQFGVIMPGVEVKPGN